MHGTIEAKRGGGGGSLSTKTTNNKQEHIMPANEVGRFPASARSVAKSHIVAKNLLFW